MVVQFLQGRVEDKLLEALQLALDMDDKNLIQTKIEELNEISRPYAERIMDTAISKSMKGETVAAFSKNKEM